MAQSRAQQGQVGLYLGPHLIGTAGPGTKVGWGHADAGVSQKMGGQLRWGRVSRMPILTLVFLCPINTTQLDRYNLGCVHCDTMALHRAGHASGSGSPTGTCLSLTTCLLTLHVVPTRAPSRLQTAPCTRSLWAASSEKKKPRSGGAPVS